MDDCYFYYYARCTKGSLCNYRHEPLARGNEVTCSFWRAGKCRNLHCTFRHMDNLHNVKIQAHQQQQQQQQAGASGGVVVPVVPSSTPPQNCYWESQPGGCKKPNCPFLHTGCPPQMITKEEATASSSSIHSPPGSKIIVNKAKLEKLGGQIVLPSGSHRLELGKDSKGENTTRIVLSAKARLGGVKKTVKRRSIKDRLGSPQTRDNEERDASPDLGDEDVNSEEEDLRRHAIQSLDLRNRLSGGGGHKRIIVKHEDVEEEALPLEGDDEDSSFKIVKSIIKKVKKDKKKKKKKEKKNKKSKKREKPVSEDEEKYSEDGSPRLPSGESEEETTNALGLAPKTMEELKSHKSKLIRQIVAAASSEEDEKPLSLAAKVAAERENREPGSNIKNRLGEKRKTSTSITKEEQAKVASPPKKIKRMSSSSSLKIGNG